MTEHILLCCTRSRDIHNVVRSRLGGFPTICCSADVYLLVIGLCGRSFVPDPARTVKLSSEIAALDRDGDCETIFRSDNSDFSAIWTNNATRYIIILDSANASENDCCSFGKDYVPYIVLVYFSISIPKCIWK